MGYKEVEYCTKNTSFVNFKTFSSNDTDFAIIESSQPSLTDYADLYVDGVPNQLEKLIDLSICTRLDSGAALCQGFDYYYFSTYDPVEDLEYVETSVNPNYSANKTISIDL